jgi:hypothetical protein
LSGPLSGGCCSPLGSSGGGGGAVLSVFGRDGNVVALAGDYDTDQITNTSGVAGTTCSDALDTLAAAVAGGRLRFYGNWAATAAPAIALARAITRLGTYDTNLPRGEWVAPYTGTFTFTLTYRAVVPLVTDSIAVTVMKNSIATALALTVTPSTTSGQASASLAVTLGDGLSLRVVQTATEAQAAWNGQFSLVAVS